MIKVNYLFFLLIFLIFPVASQAVNYSLEIINIDEIGVNNRIHFAYPGIEYKVRIAVHGGTFPFTWKLTANTTCGASITESTGEITWGEPAQDNSGCTIEVKVTDSESNTDTESYTVTVTSGMDRFIWMDASNDSVDRDGSFTKPYRNFDDWYTDGSGQHGKKIVIIREGRYDFSGIPGSNNRSHGDYQVYFDSQYHPIAYIVYPNESVTFNGTRGFDTLNSGKSWIWNGSNDLYYYGIIFENFFSHAFDVSGSSNSVWNDCTFQDMRDLDGYYENDAFIFWRNGGDNIKNAILGCTFKDTTGYGSALKVYDSRYLVIEDNKFSSIADTAINWKDSVHFSVARYNVFDNNKVSIGMNGYNTGVINNEISFNFFTGLNVTPIYLYNIGTIGLTHIYRNTIKGSFLSRSLSSSDGPIHVYNNVIVNDDNHSTTSPQVRENVGEHYSITEEVVLLLNNLMGSTSLNIVNKEGLLTENYYDYIGVTGWQIIDSDNDDKKVRADVNQDSQINTTDSMLTLRNSLGLDMSGTAWEDSGTTGDVNCDGVSNSTDAMLLLRYSLGLDMNEADWCEN